MLVLAIEADNRALAEETGASDSNWTRSDAHASGLEQFGQVIGIAAGEWISDDGHGDGANNRPIGWAIHVGRQRLAHH